MLLLSRIDRLDLLPYFSRVSILPVSKMNNAVLKRQRDRLRAVRCSEFRQDITDMSFYRRFSDREGRRNGFVTLTLDNQLQHFDLSRRQVLAKYAFGEPRGYPWRNPPLTVVHGGYPLQYFIAIHILEQVPLGP